MALLSVLVMVPLGPRPKPEGVVVVLPVGVVLDGVVLVDGVVLGVVPFPAPLREKQISVSIHRANIKISSL